MVKRCMWLISLTFSYEQIGIGKSGSLAGLGSLLRQGLRV